MHGCCTCVRCVQVPQPLLFGWLAKKTQLLNGLAIMTRVCDQCVCLFIHIHVKTQLLGGRDKVAELTGRKGGLVATEGDTFKYEARNKDVARKNVNMKEKVRGSVKSLMISQVVPSFAGGWCTGSGLRRGCVPACL